MSASLREFMDLPPKMGDPMPATIEAQAEENPIERALHRGATLARLRAQAGAKPVHVRNKPLERRPLTLVPEHSAVRHICVSCACAEQADREARMCAECFAQKRQPIVLPLPPKTKRRGADR